MKTVANMSLSRDNKNNILLTIEDGHSGDRVIRINMDTHDFAMLVTGMSGIKGVAEYNEKANIAKKREVKKVSIDIDGRLSKDQMSDLVDKDYIENYALDGWVLHNNGATSQQNTQNKHNYTIKRYVDVENPLEIEKYY